MYIKLEKRNIIIRKNCIKIDHYLVSVCILYIRNNNIIIKYCIIILTFF